MLKDILTPQKLKSELEHANLSQIAKRYGVSKQYMTQVFAEYRKQYPHLFPETYPSKEWLENALKQKTILGRCNETGISYHRLRKLMEEYGIPKHTVTARFDKQKIRQQYVVYRWSDKEIAEEYGCSVYLVKKFRYDHQIFKNDRLPLKDCLTKDMAQKLINNYHLGLNEIHYIFDATPNEIQKLLESYQISFPCQDQPFSHTSSFLRDLKHQILSGFANPNNNSDIV